jgi:hypothetical protein
LSSEEREALQVELDSLSVKMDRLQEKISGLEKGTDPVGSVSNYCSTRPCRTNLDGGFASRTADLLIVVLVTDVVMFSQLKEESHSLDKWMKEVQSFLTAEDVAWGDVETLEAQLEQSNVTY